MESSRQGSSRRVALQAGLAGFAGLAGVLGNAHSAGAQGTPAADVAGAGGLILAQAFASGTLFPTQGDADAPPYTLILWGAAGRGLLAYSGEWLAVISGDALLAALQAGARPQAALVLPAPADGSGAQQAWGLTLALGAPGSDEDAVTYQGDLLPDAAASDWLGTAITAPDGAATFGPGYLLVTGLEGVDISENATVRLPLA